MIKELNVQDEEKVKEKINELIRALNLMYTYHNKIEVEFKLNEEKRNG